MVDSANNQMNCLEQVRIQYEKYPYPLRNPQDEKQRIAMPHGAYLAQINHYCFSGKQDFRNSFRVLDAGGGTGDVTIMLAESLRDTNAEIVYLDMSLPSMEITQQRANIRKLDNIKWINGSILDIDKMGLGKFDYISTSGVLHHLADPDEGLKALKNSLKEDGAIGIMVYGQYGRTGIYQMQEMLKMVNAKQTDTEIMLQNTKSMIDCLPQTNIFKKTESIFGFPKIKENNVEVYDLFLHSQDRAYTVPQIYQWIDDCGLNFVDFFHNKSCYKPERFISDPGLLNTINELPIEKQQAIAELMSCLLGQHNFYVSKKTNTIADPRELENIPFFYKQCAFLNIFDKIKKVPLGTTVNLNDDFQGITKFVVGNYTKQILKHFTGNNSLEEIFKLVKDEVDNGNEPADEELLGDFMSFYNAFEQLGVVVLRHKSIPAFMTGTQIQNRFKKKYC